MGQANRRGTYDQRKALAVARQKTELDEIDAAAERRRFERMNARKGARKTPGTGMRGMLLAAAALSVMGHPYVLSHEEDRG